MLYVDVRDMVLYMMVRTNDVAGHTQAFLRLLGPDGMIPTERVTKAFEDGVVKPAQKIPWAGGAIAAGAKFCESLLNRNYQQYKPDGWVKQERTKRGRH